MTALRLVRVAGLALPLAGWWWVLQRSFAPPVSLLIAIGGVLAVLPVVEVGRVVLDARPTVERTAWVTTVVHYVLGIGLGAAAIEATQLAQARPGWLIPLPAAVGQTLMVVAGLVLLLTVANLALQGLGAPFAIALSRRLAVGWLYAWTRNPMVLSGLAFLIAVGLWLRSLWFVLWAVGFVAPLMVAFLKVYEERELEIRFGAPYLKYKANTPMLWPRRPRGWRMVTPSEVRETVEQQSHTALVVPVHEAAFVQPFRVKHLHRPGVTMPPHVTVCSPFKAAGEIDASVLDRLAKLCASQPRFQFVLATTARFSDTGVLYLVPEPAEPFHALHQAIRAQYPDVRPSYPDPVMHLTLARSSTGELDCIERKFHHEHGSRLPIEATAAEVCLFVKGENTWVKHTAFALADGRES